MLLYILQLYVNLNKNYILAVCVLARARWRLSTTHAKQWPGKTEDERTHDWERSTARDESSARIQWLREVIPDQNMFAKDGTRNLKHGGCGGSEFRRGLMAVSDRNETSNWSADYWEVWNNVYYVSYESGRKLNAQAHPIVVYVHR